jgi:hypothetical protein
MQLISYLVVFLLIFSAIGCSRTHTYYLKQARLVDYKMDDEAQFLRERKEEVKLLLHGHYIKSGDYLIILLRKFERGSLFAIDDEGYEKLTIEIKEYKSDVPISLSSNDINFYYSSGSSGFISRAHGVYSSHGSGEITIKDIGAGKLFIKMNISLMAKPAGPFPFEERIVKIKEEVVAKEMTIDRLTPWLGVPDPSSGKEVYP